MTSHVFEMPGAELLLSNTVV